MHQSGCGSVRLWSNDQDRVDFMKVQSGGVMSKHLHEIRDPIHVFVRLDSDERAVLDSWPFQRLRHIHQLAMTYMLYPAATHKRFEHSLGVMELAGRVFDVVTNPANVSDEVRKILPEVGQPHQLQYWRRALRMAALCHDMGHLPFSHAAEKELLPEGWDHERLTREIILSPEMAGIWMAMTPPLRPMDVVKLSVGPRKARDITFTSWESILAEIIVGDAFGADRMDYLLRDSYHAGVAYGRFDHFRLIDTLRIIPLRSNIEPGTVAEPTLGVEEGGVHSAEACYSPAIICTPRCTFTPSAGSTISTSRTTWALNCPPENFRRILSRIFK